MINGKRKDLSGHCRSCCFPSKSCTGCMSQDDQRTWDSKGVDQFIKVSMLQQFYMKVK